ncbi:hypothetical protein A0K93_04935 [Corynebacterium sp. BCW_4722]|nr:hypothetical protein A0K93_04935 [Corynebacterium sp. BCW_4722]
MAPKLYPLAPSTWGAGREIPVGHISQAALFSDFAGQRGSSYFEVVLEANPLNSSWRVRRRGTAERPGPVLGEIAPELRALFPEVERVHTSLLRPVTLAAVKLQTDSGRFDVDVLLPEPQLAVPRNDAPETAAVLPAGDMFVVDTSTGEFDADELASRSPGQWLVGLQLIDGSVVATLSGRVLGSFAESDNDTLAEWAQGFEPGGLWARAVLLDGMAALDAGAPEEGAAEVPALSAPDQRDGGALHPWQLIEFPDGGWAVSVVRDAAVDPGDIVKPRHTARYVSLEGEARPEELGAPTEMFNRVEHPEPAPGRQVVSAPATHAAQRGEYLTEVEKVQLRRRNDVKRRGGRHRR